MTKMCVAAANYLIAETNRYNGEKVYVSMTCKRLQKLLYFSDIEYMKKNNGCSMFRDNYYAWPSGPVIPSVYSKFMTYQNGHMNPINEDYSSITPSMKECLDFVLSHTWSMDTLDLIELTHVEGGPWKQAFNEKDANHEQIISKAAIYSYYRERTIFD